MIIYYEMFCFINMRFSSDFLNEKFRCRDSILCLSALMVLLILNVTAFQGEWKGNDQIMAASCLVVSFIYVWFCLGQPVQTVFFTGLLMYMLPELTQGMVSSLFLLFYPGEMQVAVYQAVTVLYLSMDLVLLSVFYYLLRKRYHIRPAGWDRYLGMFFLPAALLMLVLGLTRDTGYWNMTSRIDIRSGSVMFVLPSYIRTLFSLFFCFTGIICLFLTLEAFQRVLQFSKKEQEVVRFRTQISMQKSYIEECILRVEATKSLRHDWKNHLTVIHQLLKRGDTVGAEHYLDKLQGITDGLSSMCNTGNASVDALLSYKLGMAEQSGILISCELKLPGENLWEELDLCVVLANAIDNATDACRRMETGKRYINIRSVRKGIFFMIEVENSAKSIEGFQWGTGLCNIEKTAQKYKGKIETTVGADFFRLCILLIISEH